MSIALSIWRSLKMKTIIKLKNKCKYAPAAAAASG